jgi:HK97 family phage major capsid protein
MTDISHAIADLGDAFSGFKSEYSSRVSALETKANRPRFADDDTSGNSEYRSAFLHWVRKGDDAPLRAKAWSIGGGSPTGSDGGFTVPTELFNEIVKLAKAAAPFRSIARAVRISTGDFKVPVSTTSAAAAWAAEADARSAQNTPVFAQVSPPGGELYTNLSVSQWLMDDSQFDLESWLVQEITESFGVTENASFISGDGTAKPKGILAYTTAATADASRAFGTVEHLATGVAADLPSTSLATYEKLVDVVHALKASYRQGAVWVMNASTLAKLRKLVDDVKRPLYTESLVAGSPGTLLGYPVIEDAAMPSVGAGNFPIAYGNFGRAYLIGDRVDMRMVRDPFTSKGNVGFYCARRVYGGVVDSAAYKLLKCST